MKDNEISMCDSCSHRIETCRGPDKVKATNRKNEPDEGIVIKCQYYKEKKK